MSTIARPRDVTRPAAQGAENAYRTRLLAIILSATFFSVMNSNMVNTALPTLMADFHIGITTSIWLYTGYTLPYAVSMPLLGQLGERVGAKRVFLVGVVAFLASSLLCSAAWSFPSLLGFRVLQALGAAAVIPNAMVLITAAFPPNQRGRALGLWSATSGIAVGVGPTLGGVLTQFVSWHAIFWVNAPFLLAIALGGARAIRPLPTVAGRGRFDLPGSALLIIGIGALMIALTVGQTDGWGAPQTLVLFLIAAAGLAIFLAWEPRIPGALLPIALFRRRAYAAATATGFLQAVVMFGLMLLLPIYLQSARGHTPTEAGLMILPLSAALVVVAPVAGLLSDRFGPLLPTASGMLLVTVGMVGFAQLTLGSPYLALAVILLVTGAGIALSISPVTSTVMNAAQRQERGRASGFFNLLRFLGAVVGSTVLSVVLTGRSAAALPTIHVSDPHLAQLLAVVHGFHDAYLVGAAIGFAGFLTALLLRPGYPTSMPASPADTLVDLRAGRTAGGPR
ncbi:MAG: MFS transporter [Chloroflexi bacterium]|nr:MFS transporter [Chloroflexota bacterium]